MYKDLFRRICSKRSISCLSALLACLTLTQGCSTRPVLPDSSDVKVSRTAPKDERCESIGPIEGRSLTAKGNPEEALKDATNAAAHKGANFVHIQSYSETGTAVRAEGFVCP